MSSSRASSSYWTPVSIEDSTRGMMEPLLDQRLRSVLRAKYDLLAGDRIDAVGWRVLIVRIPILVLRGSVAASSHNARVPSLGDPGARFPQGHAKVPAVSIVEQEYHGMVD